MASELASNSLIPNWNDATGSVPHIRLDTNSLVARPALQVGEADEEAARRFRTAYLATVAKIAPGMERTFHLAVSEDMRASDGSGTHAPYLVADHVPLADTVARMAFSQPQYLDHVVVVAPEVVAAAEADVERAAAGDVSRAIEHLYPIEVDGPLEPYLPAFVQQAALVVVLAAILGETDDRAKDAATARMRADLAELAYPGVPNGEAMLDRDLPFVGPVGDAVAFAAADAAKALAATAAQGGLDLAALVEATHGAVADAIGGLGGRVLS